jgi:hypothetical protein
MKVEAGTDDNRNGTLEASEVDQTSFLCDPVPRKRAVFMTSAVFDGNLGGAAGANAKCQAAADAVPSLAGKTFRAWISDSSSQPATSFTTDGGFVTVDGDLIAESWWDLRDTVLGTRIKTEHGDVVSGPVWTGTDELGFKSGYDCNDWTANDDVSRGSIADPTVLLWYWSYWESVGCASPSALYCFEQ